MDPLLVTVTALSLTCAVGMGILAFRLFSAERQRSAARVTALLMASAQESTSTSPALPLIPIPHPERVRRAVIEDQARPEPVQKPRPVERSDVQVNLFASSDSDENPGRPRFALAALLGALVVGAALAGVYATQQPPADQVQAVERVPAAAVSKPLELVSMRHLREGDTLTITGLVRNPIEAKPMKNVTAVAFVFDRNGEFVASGRAPLDFATLTPGEESPFQISIRAGTVGRYRVSFRIDDGGVVPHVDRRQDMLAARQPTN